MIGGGFLGGGISIVPAGKALIYASMTTEDGNNIPNAVFKAVRTGSTVTANGGVDGRAELLVDAGHTYTVTVTPAGGSYLNNSQTVVTASAKSYAVKFYLYPAKANEASTTASLISLNTSISTHAGNTSNPHSVTKAQVGLGAYPTSPANIGISTATQTALNGKADKTMVNDGLALKADKTEVTAHTGRTDNPHGVTKAQVGLGAYPTSPANIGISTATQTALNGKVNKTGDTMSGILTLNQDLYMQPATGPVYVRQYNRSQPISQEEIVTGARYGGLNTYGGINNNLVGELISGSGTDRSYWLIRTRRRIGGSDVLHDFGVNISPTGEKYVNFSMRSAPGATDGVNTKYVLDRVAEMVDFVDDRLSGATINASTTNTIPSLNLSVWRRCINSNVANFVTIVGTLTGISAYLSYNGGGNVVTICTNGDKTLTLLVPKGYYYMVEFSSSATCRVVEQPITL